MIKPHDTVKAPDCTPDATVWDYAALETLEEFRELADEATVVIALDTNSDAHHVAYGTEVLRAIASEVIPPQECTFLFLAVDYKSLYVEHLCAALHVTKGFHEWSGGVAKEGFEAPNQVGQTVARRRIRRRFPI